MEKNYKFLRKRPIWDKKWPSCGPKLTKLRSNMANLESKMANQESINDLVGVENGLIKVYKLLLRG